MTYVYRCVTCGHISDFDRPLNSDAQPDICRQYVEFISGRPRQDPMCGGLLVRHYTPPALIGCKP